MALKHLVTAGFAYDVEANTSIHKQDSGDSSANREGERVLA
jgi:hypothetical protein